MPASPGRRPTACFYAPVRDASVLSTTEFYAQDLDILRELGFEVTVATRWAEVPWSCDLYYIWWWTWAFVPLSKALLSRRPSLITGTVGDKKFRERRRHQRAIIGLSARAAGWNVTVSEMERRFVEETLGTSRVSCVPHGVDTAKYRPGDAPRGDFLLSICWMDRTNAARKCMFELIAALPRVLAAYPGARLRVVGDPMDGAALLLADARRLGVDHAVEFLGRASTAEKVRLLQTCRAYLQPSRFEGFGLAIAEAMACGAPVLTSPVGAVPEVVGDAVEFVDGTDPASIAGGIIRLWDDPWLRDRRSAEGRARIESTFPLSRRRDGLAAVISRLTGKLPANIPPGGPPPPF